MIRLYENATHIIVTGDYNELEIIRKAFRFRPLNYFRAPSYERFRVTCGEDGWDGYIYPLRHRDGSGRILRGYREHLIALLKDEGIEFEPAKMLPRPFASLGLADVRPDLIAGDFELDQYQRRCIQQWLAHGIGVCNVTVAGGKTCTFAGAAQLVKERFEKARFLYLTPSERLVRQVFSDMKKFLPGWDIGQYGGGRNKPDAEDMVVCTVAMLHRHFKKLTASGWFKTFMAILFDECHHAGSETSEKIVLSVPAYFRLGASDTRKEDDPSRFNAILGLFGPLVAETAASPLMQVGRVARPHHYLVDIQEWHNRFNDVPFSPETGSKAVVLQESKWVKGIYRGPVYERDKDGNKVMAKRKVLDDQGEWTTVDYPVIVSGLHAIEIDGEVKEIESRWCLLERLTDRGIVRFKERNQLIVDWAVHFSKRDLPTLIVCTRTLHIYILEALLKQTHPDPEKVDILFGWASSKERDTVFQWFRDTPGAVLITPLVKEGVSINEIRAGIIADNVADWERANQIAGRFMRKKKKEDDNRAEIVWFVDRQHPKLRRNAVSVFTQLEKIAGYTFYHPCSGPESIEHALEIKVPDIKI